MTLPLVPTQQPGSIQHWAYVLARAVNALIQGRASNVGSCTLTAGSASTVVTNNLFQSAMVPVFVPTTANAAGALATTYVSARANGSFTLTHANNAEVDRTFLYLFWG
jgi:hypothetical protein